MVGVTLRCPPDVRAQCESRNRPSIILASPFFCTVKLHVTLAALVVYICYVLCIYLRLDLPRTGTCLEKYSIIPSSNIPYIFYHHSPSVYPNRPLVGVCRAGQGKRTCLRVVEGLPLDQNLCRNLECNRCSSKHCLRPVAANGDRNSYLKIRIHPIHNTLSGPKKLCAEHRA